MRMLALLSMIALLAGACAGLNDDAAGTNQVTVLLANATEAPISVAAESEEPLPDALRVTFGRVALVPADDDGEGIVELELAGEVDLLTVNLLELSSTDVQQFAETLELPAAGIYTQLRLIVDSAEWVFGEEPDESTVPIFVPSGAQSGLKINIEPPLEIAAADDYVLTVVFDVEQAIVEAPPGSGNYLLKPTAVRVLNDLAAGADAD
jgi:hypothetical protein